ncbi:3-ketoacyl-CoA thiolase with broad chain length specificity [Sparganum proliferum]
MSITDPSLCGDRFPLTCLCDSVARLPPVKEIGDVVIMHRLKIDMFRGHLQGSGCVPAGFAAAVFPGSLDAELRPRDSSLTCSYTDADIEVVRSLKLWYNSSDCPVEKERPFNGSTTTTDREIAGSSICSEQPAVSGNLRPDSSSSPPPSPPKMTRLHAAPLNAYFNIEGQVIGVYPYPDGVNDVVIYLWDGIPDTPAHYCAPAAGNTYSSGALPFFRHTDSDLRPPDRLSRVDPPLVALTGHRVLPACCTTSVAPTISSSSSSSSSSCCDWSVPVFLFDEHAASCQVVRDLRPGDLVRLINVRCGRKRVSDGRTLRKLDLNGGGEKYGRCIELMRPDSHIATGLLSRLSAGRAQRPALVVPASPAAQLLPPLTIRQIARLPEDFAKTTSPMDPVESQSFLQVPSVPGFKRRWLDRSASLPPHRHENNVHLRVCARITAVHPHSVDDMSDCLFFVCHECRSATRLSTLSDSESFIRDCTCASSSTDGERIADLQTASAAEEEEFIAGAAKRCRACYRLDPPRFSVLPTFRLLLQDPTGELGVSVFADGLISLLGVDVASGSRLKELLFLWQNDYDGWLRDAQHLLSAWLPLVGGWIDGLVSIAWRRQSIAGGAAPISSLPSVLMDVHLDACRRLSPSS